MADELGDSSSPEVGKGAAGDAATVPGGGKPPNDTPEPLPSGEQGKDASGEPSKDAEGGGSGGGGDGGGDGPNDDPKESSALNAEFLNAFVGFFGLCASYGLNVELMQIDVRLNQLLHPAGVERAMPLDAATAGLPTGSGESVSAASGDAGDEVTQLLAQRKAAARMLEKSEAEEDPRPPREPFPKGEEEAADPRTRRRRKPPPS
jgi:hypothetical protein